MAATTTTTSGTVTPTTLAPPVSLPSPVLAAPTRAALLSYIALCQAAVTAAVAVRDSTTATRHQRAAARHTAALYNAEIAEAQALLAPTSPQVIVVQAGDTLPHLAQRYYGDHTRTGVKRIQRANHLTGLAIQSGQSLTIPAA